MDVFKSASLCKNGTTILFSMWYILYIVMLGKPSEHPEVYVVVMGVIMPNVLNHDDVIKWKHFMRYWPFVRSPGNSPHKGQWRGALMFYLFCIRINGWLSNREAGDLRRYCAHYDVTVMMTSSSSFTTS